MNEQLQNKLINWLSEAAQTVGDWAAKEIPPFIDEYLLWKFWENAIGIGIWLFGVVVGLSVIILIRRTIYRWADNKLKDEEVYQSSNHQEGAYCDVDDMFCWKWIPIGVAILAVTIASLLYLPTTNIFNCVKIKIAPKVYLLEEVARLVK